MPLLQAEVKQMLTIKQGAEKMQSGIFLASVFLRSPVISAPFYIRELLHLSSLAIILSLFHSQNPGILLCEASSFRFISYSTCTFPKGNVTLRSKNKKAETGLLLPCYSGVFQWARGDRPTKEWFMKSQRWCQEETEYKNEAEEAVRGTAIR